MHFSNTPPDQKHTNRIKTKTWCSLTETQGFEEWLKIDNYSLLTNFLQLIHISAYGKKEKEHTTTS